MPVIGTQGALTFIKLGGGPNYNSWFLTGTNVTRFEGSAFDSSENIYLTGVGGTTGGGGNKSLWMKINVDTTGNIAPNIAWSTISNLTGNIAQTNLNKRHTLRFESNNITSVVTGKMNSITFSQINYPIYAANGLYGSPIVFSAPHNANIGSFTGDAPTRTIGDFIFSNNTIVCTGMTNQKPASNVSDWKLYFNTFYTGNGQLQYDKVYGNSTNVTTGSDGATTIQNIGNNYIVTCNYPNQGTVLSIDTNISNINWQNQITDGAQNLIFYDSTANSNNIFTTADGAFATSYLINNDNTGNIGWAFKYTGSAPTYIEPFKFLCIDTNNSNLITVGYGSGLNNANGFAPIINFDANTGNINWQRGIYFIGTGAAGNINVRFLCTNVNITGNNMILTGTYGNVNQQACVIQLPKSGFIPGSGEYDITPNLKMYYTSANLSLSNVTLTKTSLSYSLLTPASSNSGNTTGTIFSNTATGTFVNMS